MYYLADKVVSVSERNGLSDILTYGAEINRQYNFDTLYEYKKMKILDLKENEKLLTDGRGKYARFIFDEKLNRVSYVSVKTKYCGAGVFKVFYFEMYDYYIWKWIVSMIGGLAVFIFLIYQIYKKQIIIGKI